MKINHTSKLFYGKYAYKVVVLVRTQTTGGAGLEHLIEWCDQNITDRNYKLVSRHHESFDWHQSVYVANINDRQKLITQFGADVVEIWQPLDDQHLSELGVSNIVQVRSSLIYKKYAHAVYFRYDKSRQLHKWLVDYFDGRSDVKLNNCIYWPTLYLQQPDDITALRLIWPDSISYVRTVKLITNPS